MRDVLIQLKYEMLASAFQELWCNKQLESGHIIRKLFLGVCYRLLLLVQGFWMERNNHWKSGVRGFLKRKNLRGGLKWIGFARKEREGIACWGNSIEKMTSVKPEGRSCVKTTHTFQTVSDVCLCIWVIRKVEFAFLSVWVNNYICVLCV